MNDRDYVTGLLSMIDCGTLDARDVLENVLTNYLSTDDAEEFITSEYGDMFDGIDEDGDSNEY